MSPLVLKYFLALLPILVCTISVRSKDAKAPNVLILLTDDQGWGDNQHNCENSTGMCARTPHLTQLVQSPHTALFHRFYSAASVCSPTRASILTGRTNNRDCIDTALPCCNQDPAPTCAMGVHGGLPHTEFTVAKAAKKSSKGDYATIQLGKWHLGDLWDKGLPGMSPEKYSVSNPGHHGFDEWVTTQAEASNSMSNCGCFPVNHTHPGPKPPSGYDDITPHGNQCVVGGGAPSDWCYPCTNYYFPNASDPRNVTDLSLKIPGDDSTFLVDKFESFLKRQTEAGRPWLAHICFHAIHEPHPAMPEFYDMYAHDPDYLGAITMWDAQVGRIMALLKEHGADQNTAIFYTADNGPHQGMERSDIRYSTNFLRQCKASMWEGGIRVPGAMYYPPLISQNLNISMPATSSDVLPTIMHLLDVESDNPDWILDGVDLVPILARASAGERNISRPKLLGFDSTGGQHAIIDNRWKLLHNPGRGQCDYQAPYDSVNQTQLMDAFLLFDLENDPHELRDLSSTEPERFARMKRQLTDFLSSVEYSQVNETGCASYHEKVEPIAGVLPSWALD